jgi:hypothetical protein
MTLGRLKMNQRRSAELTPVLTSYDKQPTLQHHNQRMLMHLMIVKPLSLRKSQQDHTIGVLVRAKNPRRVSLNTFSVQLPKLHVEAIIRGCASPSGAPQAWFGSLDGTTFEVHVGAEYRAAIAPRLRELGAIIEQPLLGLSMGRQLSSYRSHTSAAERRAAPAERRRHATPRGGMSRALPRWRRTQGASPR